jgi:hypothetical protein
MAVGQETSPFTFTWITDWLQQKDHFFPVGAGTPTIWIFIKEKKREKSTYFYPADDDSAVLCFQPFCPVPADPF